MVFARQSHLYSRTITLCSPERPEQLLRLSNPTIKSDSGRLIHGELLSIKAISLVNKQSEKFEHVSHILQQSEDVTTSSKHDRRQPNFTCLKRAWLSA